MFAIVDDTDLSQISYSGPWGLSSFRDQHYSQTAHYTKGPGASASFTFIGDSIEAVGSIFNQVDDPIANVTFRLDSEESSRSLTLQQPGSRAQQTLFKAGDLPYGEHTLTLTLTSATGHFALDFFKYHTPDTVLPDSPGVLALVDDADPAITYSGHWLSENEGSTDGELGRTTHGATDESGAIFNFNGTYLHVVGTLTPYSSGHLVSTFILDNQPTVLNISGIAQVMVQQTLFKKTVPDGEHTLEIKYRDTKPSTLVPLWLDYIVYQPSKTSSVLPGVSTISGTPGASASASAGKSSPIGIIIGAVAGGLAAISIVAIVLIVLWRRKLRQGYAHPNSTAPSGISPYIYHSQAPVHWNKPSSSPSSPWPSSLGSNEPGPPSQGSTIMIERERLLPPPPYEAH